MNIPEVLLYLVKNVGVPFTLLIIVLWRVDFYIDRCLNHFGELTDAIDALKDEVKNFKYYIHLKEPPRET